MPGTEGTTGPRAHGCVPATGEGDIAHGGQQGETSVCKRNLGASNWGREHGPKGFYTWVPATGGIVMCAARPKFQ